MQKNSIPIVLLIVLVNFGVSYHSFSQWSHTNPLSTLNLVTGGNVGIGTDVPDKRLTINGELGFFRNGTSSMNTSVGYIKYVGGFIFGTSSVADPLRFQTNSIDRLYIRNNGNIGTTDPDAKLTVKGDIHTSEVRVDLNGAIAPDYVFEKAYKLIPLAELECYINQNKHLPEIPSAKEMDANGLNLKEMNLLLLKKVEELTLHLLSQQKQIVNQQDQITELKNKVK